MNRFIKKKDYIYTVQPPKGEHTTAKVLILKALAQFNTIMGLLSKKIATSKKATIKGEFNIKAMALILENDKPTHRDELLELNIKLRLAKKFDFDFEALLSDDVVVDELSEEHLAQYNELSAYIDEVYKTSQDQANAFITNTSNHRSFNGWAAIHDIMYVMTWNVGKTEIVLTPSTKAGKSDVIETIVDADVEVVKVEAVETENETEA